jgi:transposase
MSNSGEFYVSVVSSENFVGFLADLVRQTPSGLDLHCIADNLSAHKTGAVATFLEENPP